VRLPDELFNRLQTHERWVVAKILREYALMLARSPLIPWQRKLYAPVILQRYGWALVRSQLTGELQRTLGSNAWSALGRLRRLFRT
jgi:hypothetical protein